MPDTKRRGRQTQLANRGLPHAAGRRGARSFTYLLVLASALLWSACPHTARPAALKGAATAVDVGESHAEHAVVAPAEPIAKVARATFVARLPIAGSMEVGYWNVAPRADTELVCDRRRALRQVQARRSVPRMNSEEPPWI